MPPRADRVRLARNHLDTPAPKARLVDVVRELCAVQAQLLSAAELALSARVKDLTQADVRIALWERRSLVRAWTVRGTIHVVPADDLPLWSAAIGASRYWESPEWLARSDLTVRDAVAVFDTITDALDGKTLTRQEIADAVAARVGARLRPKIASLWGELLAPVTYMGRLCFGPMRGPNVTFVRADQWVRSWRDIAPDEAWSELVRRFLRTYGPAPLEGIAGWFGLDPARARALLASLGSDVVDHGEGWVLRGDRRAVPVTRRSVRLLPQYDAYVMGTRPRERIVPDAVRARIRTFRRGRWEGAAGVPLLLVDGVVAGVWDRRARHGRIAITVEPVLRLTARQRLLLAAEARRVGRFLGRDADLEIGPIGTDALS